MTESNKRVFLDTVTLANIADAKDAMDRLIQQGYTLVIPNTAVDVKAFQDNTEWLHKQLETGTIVIQLWMTPDEMVSKAFTWSSCGETTQPSACLEDAIENLPNWEGILQVAALMERYGLSKEEWNPGQWSKPEPLGKEQQETLGVPDGATRTEILAACKFTGHMEMFDEYNAGYNRGLATQHHCTLIMNTDGNVTAL